ncbi:MAG: hypothetical protein GTO24_04420 [candidate division Zixibacteria bacterium]|nr:hypothetical protein [candidate division Zixibacteria bacterium]
MKSLTGTRIGLVFLVCLTLSLSCSDKVTMRTHSEEFMFTINGVLVKDMNLSKDIAYFTILRDGNPFDSAVVQADTHTLTNQGNGNYYKEGPSLFGFGQNVSVAVTSSGDDFTTEAWLVIPAALRIEELGLPGDTLNPGGEAVPVTWTSSANASGYLLSVVTPDTIPPVVGYAEVVKGLEETIPVEAFRTTQGKLIEGVYEVYLVAYHSGFPEFPGIAFELPEGLPSGNLEEANGTIGAGVIAEKKRIRVKVES